MNLAIASAQAGPLGLVIVLLLGVGTYLLLRSLNTQLKKVPHSFDEPLEPAEPMEPPTPALEAISSPMPPPAPEPAPESAQRPPSCLLDLPPSTGADPPD